MNIVGIYLFEVSAEPTKLGVKTLLYILLSFKLLVYIFNCKTRKLHFGFFCHKICFKKKKKKKRKKFLYLQGGAGAVVPESFPAWPSPLASSAPPRALFSVCSSFNFIL